MLLNRWLGEISQWTIIVVVVVVDDVVVVVMIGIDDRLVLEIRIFGGNFSNIIVVVVVVEEKVVVDEAIVAFPFVVDVVNFLTLEHKSVFFR